MGNIIGGGIINIRKKTTTLWTPSELAASLALWLDASDPSSITLNGSNVAQWNDKSGNNRHASQATASAQPTYLENGINDMPSLRLQNPRFLRGSFSLISSSATAFAVTTMNAESEPWARLLSVGQWGEPDFESVASSSFLIRQDIANHMVTYRFGTPLSGMAVSLSTPLIVSSRFTGTQNILNVNGTDSSQVTFSGNFATLDYVLGRATDNLSQWDGLLSEMVILPTFASTDVRQRVEGYLAHKWGLTVNLPLEHPYKNLPPYK